MQILGVNFTKEYSGESYLQNLLSNNVILDALDLFTLNNPNNDWILDSWFSTYFSDDYPIFNDIDQSHTTIDTSREGHSYIIVRQRLVDLFLPNGEIKFLKDVYYILGLYKNILSIGQITNLKNLCIFNPSKYNVISFKKPHWIVTKRIQKQINGFTS